MATSYTMNRKYDRRPGAAAKGERRSMAEDLCCLITHLEAFGITFESVVVDPDTGSIVVTVSDKIPREQLEHVGVDPVSETVSVKAAR